MKLSYLFAIALLFAKDSSAITLRFNDMPAEDNSEALAQAQNCAKSDTEILSKMDTIIELAERNSKQGSLARTMSMNKVNEAKIFLDQLKTNFMKEADAAVANIDNEEVNKEDGPTIFTNKQKAKNVKDLESKAKEF